MTKRLFFMVLMLWAFVGTARAYDFSAQASSGQTLYYSIISRTAPFQAMVVPMTPNFPYYFSDEPTGSLDIPSTVTWNDTTYSVTRIGNNAFAYCSHLQYAYIPSSVTSIGNGAFHSCSSLQTAVIPTSVTSVGNAAFCFCRSLMSVSFLNQVTRIGDSTFFRCNNLTGVIIPNSVTSIGNYAFSNCSYLMFITIGDSVSTIGNNAFYQCSMLRALEIGNSVSSIGNSAFSGCSGLTSVIIPNSVSTIGNNAFSQCTRLASLVIGNSVSSIGNSAFSGCSVLTSVSIPNSVSAIGNNAFSQCSKLRTLDIGNSVSSIGNSAFESCSKLRSVTIPNSVTSIGNSAFSGCNGLTSVNIGNSVTNIGNQAFQNCIALTSVIIPNSVDRIADNIFQNCSGLMRVSIPNSVSHIGTCSFKNCSALASVTIPNSVTEISISAFEGCSSLKTVFNCSTLPITTTYQGLSATRVVPCANSGSGANAIHQIPQNYSVVASEDNTETHIPISVIPSNFIYSNDNGTTWNAKSVVLTDCQDTFNAPVAFTAENASYSRTFTDGNRSTLCLPYSLAKPASLDVYTYASYSDGLIIFDPLVGDTITAYQPYMVGKSRTLAANDKPSFTFGASNVTFPVTPDPIPSVSNNSSMSFQGVMACTEMTNTNGYNYSYKDGFFVRSDGHACENPFRCYFTLGEASSENAPLTLSLGIFENDLLGIEEAESHEPNHIYYSSDVYDMMGRMVRKNADNLRGLPQGIYIWKGKKVFNH